MADLASDNPLTANAVSHERKLSLRATLLLLLFGGSMLLIGLGRRTLTQHEVFAAYPAKEMLAYGHWIVPMFAGIPRTAKPPTTGWFIAGAMSLFRSDSQWVVRLPAMMAALATALMMARLAARLFGDGVGLLTGLIQLTSFYVLMQARLAEADMLVCATNTAAMVCLGMGTLPELARSGGLPADPPLSRNTGKGRSEGLWLLSLGFYFFAGLSFLLKAVPIVFIMLSVISYYAIRRDRTIIRFLLNPLGMAILLVMVVAWPVAAYIRYPAILASWRFELFGTAGGLLGANPIYTYLHSIPTVLLPWTPAMALGVYLGVRRGYLRRPVGQFLACWFVPGVIFLHFSLFKHKHYPIPMLPPLSLVGAMGLLWYIRHQHANPKPMRLLAGVLWVGGCAAAMAIIGLIRTTQPLAGDLRWIIAVILAGGLGAVYLEHRRNIIGQIAAIMLTIWVVVVMVQCRIMPQVDDYRYQADLARQANRLVPANQTIWIIDPEPKVEPQIAYYLRPKIWRYGDVDSFTQFARSAIPNNRQGLFVITTQGQASTVEENGPWTVETLARGQKMRAREKPEQQLVLIRVRGN